MPQLPQVLQQLPDRLPIGKPQRGIAHLAHGLLTVALPVLAYILVRIDFTGLAVLLVFLAKWRMFALRPRYWLSNLVSNGVDIMVSVSFVLFMANSVEQWWQLLWMSAYMAWVVLLKPRSDIFSVSGQAMAGQLIALSAVYLKFGGSSLPVLILGTWLVAYISARHFLTSFEEPHSALIAHVWAYFAASLAYVLGHWLIFYGVIAQIVVLLTTIGYGTAGLYYLDANDSQNTLVRRELLLTMGAIIALVIALTSWRGITDSF